MPPRRDEDSRTRTVDAAAAFEAARGRYEDPYEDYEPDDEDDYGP
jgi:hypothetical protein